VSDLCTSLGGSVDVPLLPPLLSEGAPAPSALQFFSPSSLALRLALPSAQHWLFVYHYRSFLFFGRYGIASDFIGMMADYISSV